MARYEYRYRRPQRRRLRIHRLLIVLAICALFARSPICSAAFSKSAETSCAEGCVFSPVMRR